MSKLKIKKNEKVFYQNEEYIIIKIIDFYSVRIQSIKNPDIKLEVLISELSSEKNKKIVAKILEENIDSLKLFEKNGFVYEKREKEFNIYFRYI